jgi:hypothetical protein
MEVSVCGSTARCWALDGGSARRKAATCTQDSTNLNEYRHSCLKWDSNPRSQCLSGRRNGSTRRKPAPIATSSTTNCECTGIRKNSNGQTVLSRAHTTRVRSGDLSEIQMPCALEDFEGTCCLRLQGIGIETPGFSETFASVCQTIRRHILGGCNLHEAYSYCINF